MKRKSYEMKRVVNHPLFGTGLIGVHRIKIYEKYGDSLPICEGCGKPQTWEGCHVDHIDNDPRNNSDENIRPLHHGCNIARHQSTVSKHKKGSLPNEAMKRGFVNLADACKYIGKRDYYLRSLFKEDKNSVLRMLDEAMALKAADPAAKKLTAKQRYDAAMYESGFIRIQGWIKPEDKDAVQAFFETKAGLDHSAGEHLIKKGEKRAKKGCK